MMTLNNDLLPLIGFLLDNRSLRNTAQANKEYNRRIETICELFCRKKALSLNYNWLNTYCHYRNYQTWASKSVSFVSTTYKESLLSIFLIPFEEVYSEELNANIQIIKKVLDYNLPHLLGPTYRYIKCHENKIAGFLGKKIEILDLKNFKQSVIELEKGIEQILFFNDQLLVVQDCDRHLVFINLETGKSITSKSAFNVDELSETKNFLVLKQCSFIGGVWKVEFAQIHKQSGKLTTICDGSLHAKMSTDKEYFGMICDQKLCIYRDTGADELIPTFTISIPYANLKQGIIWSCIKFFQGLLFYKYQQQLIIIDPSNGNIISRIKNISGKGVFMLKNNQFITTDPLQILNSSSVTYYKYSFNS